MPVQLLLFSLPRSGCHLLERMLISKQTGIQQLYHPFWKDMFPLVEYLSHCEEANTPARLRDKYVEEATAAIENWKLSLTKAENNSEVLYMHTHLLMTTASQRAVEHALSKHPAQDNSSATNFTLIPDDLLLHPDTIPIFTIRDPRLTVPSTHRVMNPQPEYAQAKQRPLYIHTTNIGWNRELYDWYVTQGIEPVVVDADDYMTNPEYVRALCQRLGLDPDQAQFSWSKPTQEEADAMHPMWVLAQSSLINSEGMKPERASRHHDLDGEMGKLEDEFGEEVAGLLRECVEASMPHYEYLHSKRFRANIGI